MWLCGKCELFGSCSILTVVDAALIIGGTGLPVIDAAEIVHLSVKQNNFYLPSMTVETSSYRHAQEVIHITNN